MADERTFLIMLFTIFASVVFTSLYSPAPTHPDGLNFAADVGQVVCSCLFAVEMASRFIAFGPSAYLRTWWDFCDGVLVVICIIDAFVIAAQPSELPLPYPTYACAISDQRPALPVCSIFRCHFFLEFPLHCSCFPCLPPPPSLTLLARPCRPPQSRP